MPSQHPQAKFDPIPPDLDLHSLVENTPNFEWALRISTTQIRNLGSLEFEKLVLLHVVIGGKPLVIQGWNHVLPEWLFSAKWLEQTYDKKQENVRDIQNQTDIPMTTGHYLRSMKQLTNQWTPTNFRDERRQRLYLKDIDCPEEWQQHLQKVIPPSLYYMNGNVELQGEPDDNDDDVFGGGKKQSLATAGDLMSSLPQHMRAQNLMCYIGHEGTYTPAHREMCASLGQNIMVETSGSDNGEIPGSSIWFMTESKDREVVREYFLSMLGHDIEIEKHFAQINAWKKATFPVYIVEQKVGDFILVPPLAAHQVWNRGTRTIKVAWNRTTVDTLDHALREALPKARLVCRDEQYKNKSIIFYTLEKYYDQLVKLEEQADTGFLGLGQEIFRNSPRTRQLESDFKRLLGLFTQVLTDEMFAYKEKEVEYIEYDSCVTCSYCRCNIFNRFLTCKHCVRTLVNGDEDAYDVCMECYAMGRSCVCISGLQWCEQWQWSELVEKYELWRAMVIKNDGFVDLETSPQPLEVARRRKGKKSVAQICQEALKQRPWKDITKPDKALRPPTPPSESEPEVDNNGIVKKKKTKDSRYKRKKKMGEVRRCHVCCHPEFVYKVQTCTNVDCKESYCYGTLYRAFDMMPQAVLEDENWKCPRCLGFCNCGACRRTKRTVPYTPKTTLLGHDTKAIADDRSVETLVDFRVHNLNWLKNAGEETRSKSTQRMQKLKEHADMEKAREEGLQVEAQQTIANGSQPRDREQQHQPYITNGYGDQSHILGGDQPPAPNPDESIPIDEQLTAEDPTGQPPDVIGHDADADHEDESAYPDPSILVAQRMIGMGYYYQQDDSPDKILFDPYQAPSEDVEETQEPTTVPEYLKKSIRAAKRKARLAEEEDPDYLVSRSHHKKKPKQEPSALSAQALDPALFQASEPAGNGQAVQETTPSEARTDDDNAAIIAQLADGAGEVAERPAHNDALKGQPAPTYDANVISLRHARPIASYVEADEVIVDVPEDFAIPRKDRPGTEKGKEKEKDPVALAADAMHSILGTQPPGETEPTATALEAETPQVKRRGRPRKNTSGGTLSSSMARLSTPPSRGSPRGRGRPRGSGRGRRSRGSRPSGLSRVEPAGSAEDEPQQLEANELVVAQEDLDISIAELEADLAQELAKDAALNENAAQPTASETPGEAPKKRRGRPPKKSLPPAVREPSPVEEQAAPQRFMSMAERLAARGKKFKMGSRRKSGGNIKESPAGGSSTAKDPATATERKDDDGEATLSRTPPVIAAKPRSGSENGDSGNDSAELAGSNRASSGPTRGRPSIAARQMARGDNSSDSDAVLDDASSSSASSIDATPVSRPARRGPTIVRLGSHSNSEDEESEPSSDSEDDGYTARGSYGIRGRASRGRGRGRGRPRGRPRGS